MQERDDAEAGSGPELIYGRNPVREALRGRRRVHSLVVASGTPGEELERLLPEWCAGVQNGTGAPRGVPPVQKVSAAELTARLKTGDHQSIAAVVDPYVYLEPGEVLHRYDLLVALDEVQDPHNLGAIIRTAEGVGAAVLIPRHRAAEVTPAVVKASAGATEHAAVARVRNLADFLGEAKSAGFWVYGAAAGAESLYSGQDYHYPTCFVLGSEGEGLGRRVASMCDVVVSLPMVGKVDSLNVSVSAGVLLFEVVRQRAAAASPDVP